MKYAELCSGTELELNEWHRLTYRPNLSPVAHLIHPLCQSEPPLRPPSQALRSRQLLAHK
jgi:hypothetical protein